MSEFQSSPNNQQQQQQLLPQSAKNKNKNVNRSLTPEKLAQSNCSQCYLLLRQKMQTSDQSSQSSITCSSSTRSQTPISLSNCSHDHLHHRSSTPKSYDHNINKSPNYDAAANRLHRRHTGKMMMPNTEPIHKKKTVKKLDLSPGRSIDKSLHPGDNIFDDDTIDELFDDSSSIETEISDDEIDSSIDLTTKTKDQLLKKQTIEANQLSFVDKLSPIIENWLNNHEYIKKTLSFLIRIEMLIIYYFIECFIIHHFIVNHAQPDQFIDEQFHLKQTQSYCDGNFTKWDNKITTPPGLYLIATIILKPIDQLLWWSSTNNVGLCQSLFALRFLNILFSLGNYYLMHKLLMQKYSTSNHRTSSIILSTLIAVHLPPLFMFTFFYYTDVGSIFFILLMFNFHQNHHYNRASIAGFISLWFRQTNIIWIFFLASMNAVNIFAESYCQYYEYKKLGFEFGSIKMRFRLHQHRLRNPYYLFCFLLEGIIQTFRCCFGYLMNGLAFIVFIYLNQGIVLGDKDAHQAVLHLAQIPYFLTFVFLFMWPLILTKENLKKFFGQFVSKPSWFLLISILLANCLSPPFTYVHPYLLADNRHYVFYIWKRFWYRNDYEWSRYWPLPLYLFTLISMWNHLSLESFNWPRLMSDLVNDNISKKHIRKNIEILRKLIFFSLIITVIVPQKLIEFRYFLTPFILWLLNIDNDMKHDNDNHLKTLFIQLFWIICMNSFTFAIFYFKTFKYGQENLIQRIIW